MKVFIVFHAGIEDDRDVRYVCETEALAEQLVSVDEVTWYGDRQSRRPHGRYCCGVDEVDVLTSFPEIEHGPDSEFQHPPRPRTKMEEAFLEMMMRPSPIDLMLDRIKIGGQIGTVTKVEEDADGIHVEARLDP